MLFMRRPKITTVIKNIIHPNPKIKQLPPLQNRHIQSNNPKKTYKPYGKPKAQKIFSKRKREKTKTQAPSEV